MPSKKISSPISISTVPNTVTIHLITSMQVRAKQNTVSLKKIIKLKTYTHAEATILRVIKQKKEAVQTKEP